MTRLLRTVFVVAGTVVLLVALAPFIFSVNQFRGPIADWTSAALGRTVELGDLNLSLFRGSIRVKDLTIADDPAFSHAPFIAANTANVGVEVWPLMALRTLRITGITMERPEVTLIRNAAGQWNYSSLATTFEETAPLSIATFALTDGRVVIGTTVSTQRSVYDHVTVRASNVTLDDPFPVNATGALPGGGSFSIDGRVGPVDRRDASLTPFTARVGFERLNLAAAGIFDASEGIGGLLDVTATVMAHDGAIESSGTATITNALLVAGGSPAARPATVNFKAQYDLHRRAGVLSQSVMRMDGADVALSGTYKAAAERTVLNVAVRGDQMPLRDLEPYLPAFGLHLPTGAHLTAGRMGAHLTVAGPTNQLVTTGQVSLVDASLSGFDLGSSLQAISAFTGVHTGSDIRIDRLTTTVRLAPAGVRLDRVDAVIPQLGRVVGAGTIDAANRLDFKMVATLASPLSVGSLAPAGTAGVLEELFGAMAGTTPRNQPRVQRVPFLVRGTASNPEFVPDVGGIVMDALQQQLKGMLVPAAPALPARQEDNPFLSFEQLLKKKRP